MEHIDANEQGDPHLHADLKKHVRTYMMVFGSLLVLTLVTVGLRYLHIPTVPAIIVALVVATIKASLVACYFMHLISERKLILILMGATVVFFFLGVLLGPVISELDEIDPMK